MRYKQRDIRWANKIMGDTTPPNPATGTIGQFGCYLTSLASGLSDLGYNFDPETLNQLIKDVHAWVGPYKNYIDSTNIEKYLPDIFVKFWQVVPWNDVPSTKDLLKPNLVVVCQVNAAAIGGVGTHFVLLTGIQDGVALIWDPWSGVEEKITKRWGVYGDILNVRVFEVKIIPPVVVDPPQTPIPQPDPVTVPDPIPVPTPTPDPVIPEPEITPIEDLPTIPDVVPVEIPQFDLAQLVQQLIDAIKQFLLGLWKKK